MMKTENQRKMSISVEFMACCGVMLKTRKLGIVGKELTSNSLF